MSSRKGAKELYEKFTLRKRDKVLEVDLPEPLNGDFPMPVKNVAYLGQLIELGRLKFKPPYPLLVTDENGEHLFVSGKRKISDTRFSANRIVYKIRKFDDKGKQDYIHRFESPKPKILVKGGEIFISDGNFHTEGRGIVG